MKKYLIVSLLFVIIAKVPIAQEIQLLTEPLENRISDIVVYGEVTDNNLPDQVYLKVNEAIFNVSVNDTGLFVLNYSLQEGINQVSVALSEEGLTNPLDEQKLKFIDYKLPSVNIDGSINGSLVELTANASSPVNSDLNYFWEEDENNPVPINLSSTNDESINFSQPTTDGEYIIYCTVTDQEGRSFKAGRMLKVCGYSALLNTPHTYANWVDNIIMYEYALFRFPYEELPFERISEKFHHIKQTGATAIWHTPPTYGGGGNYFPNDYYLIEPEYGTNDDYRSFVDKAHAAGLKVIFDIPVGHTNNNHYFLNNVYALKSDSPYKDYYYWEGEPGNSQVTISPENGEHCVYTNVGNEETKEYLIRALEYWVREYNIDGYRYDCGQEIFNRDEEFLQETQARLRNIKPDIALFIEGNYDENPEYLSVADICYDWRLYAWGSLNGFKGIFDQNITIEDFHGDFMQDFADSTLPLRYCNVGYFEPTHVLWDMPREKTGHIIAYTGHGTPLLFAGTETGSGTGPVNWTEDLSVYPFYRKVIEVKKQLLGSHPELTRLTNTTPDQVYSYLSKNEDNRVIVVANLSPNPLTTNVNLDTPEINTLSVYNFRDLISGLATQIPEAELDNVLVGLDAWETKMFWIGEVLIDLDNPIENIIVDNSNLNINIHQGCLQTQFHIEPANALDKRVEWTIDDEELVTICENGLIRATGKKNGTANITISSIDGSEAETTFQIEVTNQESYHNLIANPYFNDFMFYWQITQYSGLSEFNVGDQQMDIKIEESGVNQWDIQLAQPFIMVEPSTDYYFCFDVKSTVEQNMLCAMQAMYEPFVNLIWEERNVTTEWQTISFNITTPAEISPVNLTFMLGPNEGSFSFDNFLLRKKQPLNASFMVDLSNEDNYEKIGITGSWDDWNNISELDKNGDLFSTDIELDQDSYYEYKFVKTDANLNPTEWEEIEPGSSCEANGNRYINTATQDLDIAQVCFSSCNECDDTGEEQADLLSKFQIYPNPVSDQLYIIAPESVKDVTADLYSIKGQVIKGAIDLNQQKNRLDVSELNPGVYLVVIKHKDENLRFRFIKK